MLRQAYDRFMWAGVGSKLRRAIAGFQPDWVVSYWAHPDGAVAARAANGAGLPSAVIIGGSDVLLLPKTDPARGQKIRQALRDATLIITVSNHLRNAVIELGIPGNKVHVIYQGVDTEQFNPGDRTAARMKLGVPPKTKALLFVGNLLPVKGVDILIDACSRIAASLDPWHLYIVGTGPLRKASEEQVGRLGLKERISFKGAVLHDALPDWFRAADVTVLASRSEGIPNVLRESMACGTPFIATDVGGISEIVRPGLGILVRPNDPARLAEAITKQLSDVRGEQRQPYCEITWKESARNLIDCLQSVCSEQTDYAANRKSRTMQVEPQKMAQPEIVRQ